LQEKINATFDLLSRKKDEGRGAEAMRFPLIRQDDHRDNEKGRKVEKEKNTNSNKVERWKSRAGDQ